MMQFACLFVRLVCCVVANANWIVLIILTDLFKWRAMAMIGCVVCVFLRSNANCTHEKSKHNLLINLIIHMRILRDEIIILLRHRHKPSSNTPRIIDPTLRNYPIQLIYARTWAVDMFRCWCCVHYTNRNAKQRRAHARARTTNLQIIIFSE